MLGKKNDCSVNKSVSSVDCRTRTSALLFSSDESVNES